MIDALLHAARNAIRGAGYGWDVKTCEIMDGEQPPPRCGDWFASVHQGGSTSTMLNALNEYFAFRVTLTRRVVVPLDRVGDQVLAPKIARTLAKETGFNARAEQLRAFLHMNWGLLQDANQYLVTVFEAADVVYGFSEPAHFAGMEIPTLRGPEWFAAEPGDPAVGLKATLTFEGARRLQPIASYS